MQTLRERDMITLHVKGWDDSKAWTTFTGYHPKDLERRLVSSTGQRSGMVKRLVRQLKRRERMTLVLANVEDEVGAGSLCSYLQSLGAIVEVTNA